MMNNSDNKNGSSNNDKKKQSRKQNKKNKKGSSNSKHEFGNNDVLTAIVECPNCKKNLFSPRALIIGFLLCPGCGLAFGLDTKTN